MARKIDIEVGDKVQLKDHKFIHNLFFYKHYHYEVVYKGKFARGKNKDKNYYEIGIPNGRSGFSGIALVNENEIMKSKTIKKERWSNGSF